MNTAHEESLNIDTVLDLIRNEGYLVGDQLGNIPPQNISGIGIIDPSQKVVRKTVILWWRKTKEIYAHIASFIEHPNELISATVFGRDNIDKVNSLARKVGKLCGDREVEIGLATEHTKYGPDKYFG